MAAPCDRIRFPQAGDKLDERQQKSPPGAVIFGNFANYYTFNRPEARLEVLPDNFLTYFDRNRLDSNGERGKIVCFDVGCNTGEMTFAMQKRLGSDNVDSNFLAIDLDGDLIQSAHRKCQDHNLENFITFLQLDIMKVGNSRTSTIDDYLETHNRSRFDIVFCFSITMWIHVNHGDEGLDCFLQFLASISDRLLVEPQPWKCYINAARRIRRVGSDNQRDRFQRSMEGLRLRGDGVVEEHIDRILTSDKCGMINCASFGRTKWNRALILYKKQN